jgi:hypothetical protein
MRIIGIDPGIEGAVGLVDTETGEIEAFDLPVIGEGTKRELDARWLLNWIVNACADHLYCELVNAMPSIPDATGRRRGMGAASAFRFGFGTGQLRSVMQISATPFTLVTPQRWKGHYKLKGKDKEPARQLALHLMPKAAPILKRKMDHQRAEALLIARYGAFDLIESTRQLTMEFVHA